MPTLVNHRRLDAAGRRRPPLPHGRLDARTTGSRTPTTSRSRARSPTTSTGVYLRNTENPLHPSIGLYHPFDGDGMLHAIALRRTAGRGTATASSAPRGSSPSWRPARPLWAGLLGPARAVEARGRLGRPRPHEGRVEHRRGRAQRRGAHDLLSVRRRLPARPATLADAGKAAWAAASRATGMSAHPKVDERPASCWCSATARTRPTCTTASSSADGRARAPIDVPLPGPRLPHDMAFTEHYAILNDLPLFWDPDLLAQGIHLPRFYPDLPSRFAIVPRHGTADDIRWFEAEPTYVLHWINAYEDGDEIVLDGFFQHDPSAGEAGRRDSRMASVVPLPRPRAARGPAASLALRPGHRRGHRGAAVRPDLEFGMINGAPRRAGPTATRRHDRRARLVPVRRDREARPRDRRRGNGTLRRRRVRQRGAVRAARRRDRRGRRLPRHVHHRRRPGPVGVPGVRRRRTSRPARSPGSACPSASRSGTHGCWAPLDALA